MKKLFSLSLALLLFLSYSGTEATEVALDSTVDVRIHDTASIQYLPLVTIAANISEYLVNTFHVSGETAESVIKNACKKFGVTNDKDLQNKMQEYSTFVEEDVTKCVGYINYGNGIATSTVVNFLGIPYDLRGRVVVSRKCTANPESFPESFIINGQKINIVRHYDYQNSDIGIFILETPISGGVGANIGASAESCELSSIGFGGIPVVDGVDVVDERIQTLFGLRTKKLLPISSREALVNLGVGDDGAPVIANNSLVVGVLGQNGNICAFDDNFNAWAKDILCYVDSSRLLEEAIDNESDSAGQRLREIVGNMTVDKKVIEWQDDENNKVEMEFFVYSPKYSTSGKMPCFVFLHGGNTYANFKIEDSSTSIAKYYKKDLYSSITATLLPMIGAIVSRSYAVATITFKPESNGKRIVDQIKDQVGVLKSIGYIDGEKLFLVGHSFGGYMMSQFIANHANWLNENVNAVGIYAPVITEMYAGGSWWHGCFDEGFLRATTNDRTLSSFPYGEKFCSCMRAMHPFSDLSFITQEVGLDFTFEKIKPLDELSKKVYLFHGNGDPNTTPRQTKALVRAFNEIEFDNYVLYTYENSLHWVHRLKTSQIGCYGMPLFLTNINEDQKQKLCAETMNSRCNSFVKFINDVCSVLEGKPKASQDIGTLDSPNTKVREIVACKEREEEDTFSRNALCSSNLRH
ncbi:MAG: prolyl oligopeptidase family serine peptidase [Holosporaceae bacterium]|jgi:pimeloyl-ACP methyl ester carboxylesterase|nr:prolyl oligopeptidase family serine peptidase [Holosporaceae bacterium]